ERGQYRRQCGKRQKQQTERPQEPSRLAEIGNVVEQGDDPTRQVTGAAAGRSIKCPGQKQKDGNGDPSRNRQHWQRVRIGVRQPDPTRTRQHIERRHDVGGAAAERTLTIHAIESVGQAHWFTCERKTVSETGLPILILYPSNRWLSE